MDTPTVTNVHLEAMEAGANKNSRVVRIEATGMGGVHDSELTQRELGNGEESKPTMGKVYFEELGLRSLQMRYLQLRRAS